MQTAGGKRRFTEKVLDLRGSTEEFRSCQIVCAGVLRRDEIRHGVSDAAIVFGSENALGASQVVVQETRIWKGAANVHKEAKHLIVVECPPAWQRDLKRSESEFVGKGNSL